MLKKALLLAGMAAFGANAAQISLDKNIEVLVVDGKEKKVSQWTSPSHIELSEGSHQIVARFDGEVRDGSKDEIFTSRPYIFQIDVDNQDLKLTLPNLTLLSQTEAHFRRGAEWQWERQDGSKFDANAVMLQGQGFAAFSDMEKVVADYNRENGIVFEGGQSQDLEDLVVSINDEGKAEVTGDAFTQLKLWYTKANPEERKSFRRWIIDQE